MLTSSWLFMFNFCFTMATICDISFQTDMVMTNLRPFAKPDTRVKVQLIVGTFFALLSSLCLLWTNFDYLSPINMFFFFGFRAIFFIVAFFNFGYSAYLFTRNGLSKHYRKLLFKRHLSFCILTTVCQIVALMNYLQVNNLWN